VEAGKLLAAGCSVTASLRLGGRHGIALLEFAPGSRRPQRVQVFL
jgi:hypothetical protein